MKRLVSLLAVVLCSTTTAWAQGVRKDEIVRNQNGAAVAGATVRVCATPVTQQLPCLPLASIYSDIGLAQTLSNPTPPTGADGRYFFYAAPGRYFLEITGPGIGTPQFPDVVLGNDPAGNLVVGGPSPWFDVTNTIYAGGASASALTTMGSISMGSTTLTLTAAQDFKNGQGIAVFGAGPNPTLATPTGLAVAAQTIAATITSTGVSRSGNVVTITTVAQHNFVVGQSIVIAGTAGCATSPNGTFAIASVPAGNTFTYAQTGPNESCGSGTATPAAGTTTYSYQVAAIDNKGGITAPATTVTITNGAASLNNTQYNRLKWNAVPGPAVSITAIARAFNVVTVMTASAHGFAVFDQVTIAGVTDTSYDGTFYVASVLSTTQFTYSQAGTNSSSSGGTVTGVLAGAVMYVIYGRSEGLVALGVAGPASGATQTF